MRTIRCMRAIFISYRRDDTEGHAGRLFEDLCERFGTAAVFMDVAGIEPGRDFRRVIEQQVASCGVLLAIIGKNWLTVSDKHGKRRLDDPYDFVRLETASALKRDIPVIPVLVHDADMPREEQLPDDLKELAFRNSVELNHARWASDVQLLIRALLPHVDASVVTPAPGPPPAPPPPPPWPAPHLRPWLIGSLGVLAAGTAGYVAWDRLTPPPPFDPGLVATTAPQASPAGTPPVAAPSPPAVAARVAAPAPASASAVAPVVVASSPSGRASAGASAAIPVSPGAMPASAPTAAPSPAVASARPAASTAAPAAPVAASRSPAPRPPPPRVAAPEPAPSPTRAPAPSADAYRSGPTEPAPAPSPAPTRSPSPYSSAAPSPSPIAAAPRPAPSPPAASPPAASPPVASPPSGPQVLAARSDPSLELFGSPASITQATRTIAIGPGTSYINVTGGEVIRFDVGDKSFVWNFNGQRSSFELGRVAPPGLLGRKVTAYVAPNPMYPRRS